ncbi:SDR family oxidoreductase [Alicyclobacillus dauci]|uniref:SDR family oxidoreductase n=1 Tax=Alicyclobacillus dauci TaxID=1475485 RepID=A0ABY6Z226_9BACL|nr:SDR family oxidoreductase [Alicyclobacillus dauci]WAH36789.1 SDR family oxidoreductase [Alicyclobacillus dauci]
MIQFGSLKGKTIAITGASRGIGRETADLLGTLGANLILGSRNEIGLAKLATRVEAVGGRALPVYLDVTDEGSVRNFADVAINEFGTVDVLINSAGIGTFASLLDLPTADFDEMISVNLKGTFLACKYFGPQMVQQGHGQILNIVSIAGTVALPGGGGYSASKFGVLGLTRVLQQELRSEGVQVTAVLPGAVNSSFWDGIDPKPDVSSMMPTSTLARHIVYLLSAHDGTFIDEITIMPPLGIL